MAHPGQKQRHSRGWDTDDVQDVGTMHDLRAEVEGTREGLRGSVSTAQRRRENTYLRTKSPRAKADVVYLQETHGTIDYLHAFAVILPGWNLVGTFLDDNEDAGGYAISFRKSLTAQGDKWSDV